MWPSLETAMRLHDIANIVLICALAVGVVVTFVVVWMGNVKEEYLKHDVAEAHARGEEAKAEAARANEGAAKANERAAQAEARAAEANLALEKFKAPRVLTPQEQEFIGSKVSKFNGQEFRVTTLLDSKEPSDFSKQLSLTLKTAGWKLIPLDNLQWPFPGTEGVKIFVHPNADSKVKDAANALVSALEEIGKAPELKPMDQASPKDNKIDLSVGTKP